MEVININANSMVRVKPHVMAIGFFDGIHKGHQQLLNRAKEIAHRDHLLFSAMTFSPHPNEVIKGDTDHKYLMPLPQKIKRMEEMGVEQLFVVSFDRAFATLQPSAFIEKFILKMNTRHVVVGFDFSFGFKAKGNTQFLQEESNKHGFGLTVIPKKSYNSEKISSTKIKELVQSGQVEEIAFYLGSDYKVSVNIISDKSGKAKIVPSGKFLLPSPGSYNVEICSGNRTIQAEYYQYSARDNELVAEETLNELKPNCSMTFLSRCKVRQIISM